MQTLTVQLPDSIDPALARWELARSLYEKGAITLDEAATMVDLAPTYFRMKLAGMLTGVRPKTDQPIRKGLNTERIRQLAEEMDIQESWEDLVAMIGK